MVAEMRSRQLSSGVSSHLQRAGVLRRLIAHSHAPFQLPLQSPLVSSLLPTVHEPEPPARPSLSGVAAEHQPCA